MKYTKAINFMSGEVLTITEQEAGAVEASIRAKEEWVKVQGQFINIKAISKIGNHHATPEMKKWNESNLDRALIGAGRSDLVETRRKLVKAKTENKYRTQDEMIKKLIAGDPDAIRFYNNQTDEPKKLEEENYQID